MSLIGQILQDRYYIISAIGEGGMGRVYYAEDKRLNQQVAIKETITNSNESSQEIAARIKAFQREAYLLAGKIKHPAVPKVIDYFQFGENWYIVMEYIDGDSLEKQRKERNQPFSVKEVLLLIYQLLQILDLLHNQDPPIIHRDIKPSNIKVKNDCVYLLDFGLAKQITGSSSTFAAFMTPAFASPEQINNKEITPKSDLYSVGATMYFLLTNEEPASAFERSLAIASGSADPLQNVKKLRSDLPDKIANLIMNALSIKTEERPYSAKMMRLKINDFLTEKGKTLSLLSNISSEKVALDKEDLKQSKSNDSGSEEKSEVSLQFLTNQSLSEANLVQFASEDFGLKEKTEISSIPSQQFSASQSSVKSNFNSNDVTPPQAIKQSNKRWLKVIIILGLLIVIGVTGFGIYRNKEKISASLFPTPTPAIIPEPTPNPRDVAIQLTNEAVEEFFNNNFDVAESKAKQAIETDDTYAFSHAVYGNCIQFKRLIQSDNSLIDDTTKENRVVSRQSSLEIQKSKVAVQSLVQNPSNAKEHSSLAWLEESSEEAIKEAEKAIKLDNDFAWAWLQMALAKKSGKEAIESWEKIISLKPNFSYAYIELAKSYYASDVKSYQKAIDTFNKAINIWRTSAFPRNQKGRFLISIGESFEAKKDVKKTNEKYNEAVEEFKSATTIDSNDISGRYLIANLYFRLKKYSDCIDIVSGAISNSSLDNKTLGQFYGLRAFCYLDQDSLELENNALSDIDKAISNDEKNDDHYYSKFIILGRFAYQYYKKGEYCKALDKYNKSKEFIDKAADINPQNDDYKNQKKKIVEIIKTVKNDCK